MILSIGEVLVEVMRSSRGDSLDSPGTFLGPFASGAPAIFAAAAAKLGASSAFVGVCGDDGFGSLCRRALRLAGVDTHGLRVVSERITGIAFVGYRQDGDREFLFHLPHSASALLSPEDLDDCRLADVSWLHVTGSSLGFSQSAREACYEAVSIAAANGATVSFDPNLRFELMKREEIAELCRPVLRHATVVLPSGSEGSFLTGLDDAGEACNALLEAGAEEVLLKRGPAGSEVFSQAGRARVPSIEVEELDPTGAGDCFAAAYAVKRLEGAVPVAAARFANVAAALSTTRFGPMEGLPTRAQVLAQLGSGG